MSPRKAKTLPDPQAILTVAERRPYLLIVDGQYMGNVVEVKTVLMAVYAENVTGPLTWTTNYFIVKALLGEHIEILVKTKNAVVWWNDAETRQFLLVHADDSDVAEGEINEWVQLHDRT